MSRQLLVSALLLSVAPLVPSTASAAQLPDGTRVPVRLLSFIDSESSRAGDAVTFIVTKDVVVAGKLVIGRATRVSGVIVKARPARWGFFSHDHASLSFRFNVTTATDGQMI